MRHTDIALTMNTDTDERLLETSGAIELLPSLSLDHREKSLVAPAVAPITGSAGHLESVSGNLEDLERQTTNRENRGKPNENWVDKNGRCWIRTSDLCRVKVVAEFLEHGKLPDETTRPRTVTTTVTCESCLERIADELQEHLTADELGRLVAMLTASVVEEERGWRD